MTAPQHDTPDIVIAATRWLIHRYRQTACRELARMIERHLDWMHDRATTPNWPTPGGGCHLRGARNPPSTSFIHIAPCIEGCLA